MARHPAPALALCVLWLAACVPTVGPDVDAGTAATSAAVTQTELPGCGKPPSPAPEPPPDGAVLPPATVVTATRDEPPVIQLNAYVPSTAAGVRAWIESQPRLEVVSAAEHGVESQLLVTDGTWRTFIKVRAVCADGSLLAEVIAPEGSDAVLPTPALP